MGYAWNDDSLKLALERHQFLELRLRQISRRLLGPELFCLQFGHGRSFQRPCSAVFGIRKPFIGPAGQLFLPAVPANRLLRRSGLRFPSELQVL
jgi:hypothetical protein